MFIVNNNRKGYFANKEDGFLYSSNGEVFMAPYMNEYGRHHHFFIDEENGLDLINNVDPRAIFEALGNSQLGFKLRAFNDPEVITEATNFKIPLDAEKDMKGLNYYERIEKIDKVPHVTLWVNPGFNSTDKYSTCWIWVELPKAQEHGIKYVPIIIHNTGGVSVHPYYHKYFLRAFNKHDRHLILGFCYVYGPQIDIAGNFAAKDGRDELRERDFFWINLNASKYKDSEAPKRIDMGPKPDNGLFKASIDDYERWVKSLK